MQTRKSLTGLTLMFVAALTGSGQNLSNLPRAHEVVKLRVYVSLSPVPRERTFQIGVVAQIADGFHINAHKVMEEYLVPTSLQAEMPKGVKVVETLYPDGAMQKFTFSEKLLNVYEGDVTLRLKVEVSSGARLGPATQTLTLRYQACNDRACLPPVKLPVTVEFTIADAGARANVIHPEIFQTKAPPKKK